MRGLKHDLNNHLNSIEGLLKTRTSGGETELLEYVGKMEETVEKLDFSNRTGNAITDIIIRQKMQEAEQYNIHFTADFLFPEKLQIDVYDVSIILNNVLENAVEACKKVESGCVSLKSCRKGNLYFVEVTNDYAGDIVMNGETGLPKSSKADGGMHGVGLWNVKRCAQKYNGDIDISVSSQDGRKKFLLTVMLCGNASLPKKGSSPH